MLISIVTPAYNAERWLASTIDSVVAQTHARWEYIVVDDGSQDGTAALAAARAESDDRIRVHRQSNAGLSGARNAGMGLVSAETDAVLFLDADDLLRPRALELMLRALQADGSSPAVHGRAEGIDGAGTAIPLGGYEAEGRRYVRARARLGLPPVWLAALNDGEPTTFASLVLFNCISTPGQVLIRKSALDRVGKFDAAANPAEDWDLWIRLSLLAPLAFLPQTVLDYRRHTGNMSTQFSRMRKADLYVRHKALKASAASDPDASRTARVSLRYAELDRCMTRLRRAGGDFVSLRLSEGAHELGRASRSLLECMGSFRPRA
jgi:glycosyltransferase involved in cell wall biosynthesis